MTTSTLADRSRRCARDDPGRARSTARGRGAGRANADRRRGVARQAGDRAAEAAARQGAPRAVRPVLRARSAGSIEQLELQLADLEETAAEDEAAAEIAAPAAERSARSRRHPQAGPPALCRSTCRASAIVYPAPCTCPKCGGTVRKLGEDVTETLECVPRRWKVVQHVREKFSCRRCEAISQPPAPSHPIARGRAGPSLLALVLAAKYGQHLPLNRQSEIYAREGVELDVSTLADWVGAAAASLMPLVAAIRAHVFAAERLHADDTTVPVLAKGKTRTAGCGPMCATTGRSAGPIRRRRRSSTRPIAAASIPSAPGRLHRHHAGRRLCRLQRALRAGASRGRSSRPPVGPTHPTQSSVARHSGSG